MQPNDNKLLIVLRSVLSLSTLLFLAATVFAQGAVRVIFPTEGERAIWTAPDLSITADEGTSISTATYDFEGILNDYVLALDRKNGNVAYKKVRDLSGEWKVQPNDYKLIGFVNIRVEHQGKPLKTASVRVNGSAPKIIDAESKGLARFGNISPGDIKVEVAFRSDKKDRTVRQSFEVPLIRSEAIPQLVVSVAQPVETIAEMPKATASSETPKVDAEPKPKNATTPTVSGFLSQLLLFLVAAAALSALMYFALKWVLNNEDKTKDTLTKFGVPVQDPDPSGPPPAPSTQPDPVSQPILLGPDASPTASVSPAPQSFAVAPGGELRLVQSNGIPLTVREGTNLVGREPSCDIPFEGESTISRRHAEVIKTGDALIVKDLGSTNGTFVNGIRVQNESNLYRGDMVQFGAIQIRVE